jgi:uncharacterized protein YacL
MIVIGIILLIAGGIGMLLGSVMFGDIGVAAMIGAIAAILSGIGFIICSSTVSAAKKQLDTTCKRLEQLIRELNETRS